MHEPTYEDLRRLAEDVVREDGSHAVEGAKSVGPWLSNLSAVRLPRLDRALRSILPPADPRVVKSVARSHDDVESTIATLFSFHRDGYVRQAAVERLATTPAAQSLPPLLLRTTDWVSVVRHRACEATRAAIRGAAPDPLIRAWPLVVQLERRRRSVPIGIRATIHELLVAPGAIDARDRALIDRDPAVRGAAFALSLDADSEEAVHLIRRALIASDPVLRALAARSVRRLPRCDALSMVELLLLCPDGALRAWAQRQLRKRRATFDLSEFYRDHLQHGDRVRAALYGIGETGTPSDVPLVLGFLGEPRTRIRRAALYALARLDMESAAPAFVESLAEDRPRVARDAARWLCRYPHVIEAQRSVLLRHLQSPDGRIVELARTVLHAGCQYAQRWA